MSIQSNFGKKIYQNNKPLRDLSNVMEHPMFKDFFNTYFNNPQNSETMLLFMKIYNSIECNNPYEKLEILFNIIGNTKNREKIITAFSNWKNFNNMLVTDGTNL